MAPWKAPGSDGIPADLLQHCKSCLLPLLHNILVKCWRESILPKDMCDAKIITYKNKGTRSDCSNHRRILLGIGGKTFVCVFHPRLQKLAERVYPESQCGFRSKRFTTDMIFCVRQLQEKCNEQNVPLYSVGKMLLENINCHYFKTNEGKWKLHASYFISKPHKTITQSSLQYAILKQQLLAQFVL